MVKKGILAAEARESARKARQLVRDRKGVLGGGSLRALLDDEPGTYVLTDFLAASFERSKRAGDSALAHHFSSGRRAQ